MLADRLSTERFVSQSTGTEVEYKVLVAAEVPSDSPLPLILHLHGAMSSAASLEAARPAYEHAWSTGELPPAIIACASTPTMGGFYIDHAGGQKWETLVGVELPRHLEASGRVAGPRAALGFSMGGYGALKVLLRQPTQYIAVAALTPVILPAEKADEVKEINRPSILNDLNQAMGLDVATYEANSVYGIARNNVAALHAAAPAIYLDCGAADEFRLHEGAEYLHRLLGELAVPHIFRSVPDGRHIDDKVPERQEAAIRFIGGALKLSTLQSARKSVG